MSLFGALSVGASALAAQRTRAEVIVENLANLETTRTPEGGPYRRKDVVFESAAVATPFASVMAAASSSEGVRVAEIAEDQRDPIRRYQPGHPDADAQGYVAYPRVNLAEDMVDLMSATRGYQANISAMSSVKEMMQRSLDLLR